MTLSRLALRYWHTLRHLKPVQIYGRLVFYVRRPQLSRFEKVPTLRIRRGPWSPPAARKPSMLGPDRFVFLNRQARIATTAEWNDPTQERLWLYNLHYFDDLNALNAAGRQDWQIGMIQRWVRENPPSGGVGWEPYPASLRIVNWIKWSLAGNKLPDAALESLALQTRWLGMRLEWHLLGNHLFANAKALVFAGLFFEGTEAREWLDRGLRIITRELPEQVLPDGGNFERSTMYHAIFLEDVLDLANVATAYPGLVARSVLHDWTSTASLMLDWMGGMTHPDREIALFNDAAFGIAPSPADLYAYAKRIGVSAHAAPAVEKPIVHCWSDSGYVRLESRTAVALLDVAPVGPNYLSAHAHADTLSFELSVYGRRVVVNGGTSRYGLGPERIRERETAAHSTVEIDGESSSEVWAGFRMGRRAYPFGLIISNENDTIHVSCSHDGYRRLSGGAVHHRAWLFSATGLVVEDTVTGSVANAVARFILHPDIGVAASGKRAWSLSLPGGQHLRIAIEEGHAHLYKARYAPEFGKVLPTHSLTVELMEGRARTRFDWD